MALWTTHEIRTLVHAHKGGAVPPRADLAVALPRHTLHAISNAAQKLRCRKAKRNWLKIAHQHFARREQGHLR